MKKENGVLIEVTKKDIPLLDINPQEFWKDVEVIGENAFTNSGIVNLAIPNTVKAIEKRAFHSCKHLQSVAIPEGIIKIEKSTFQWCWSLNKILLPQSIVNIDDFAFAGCEKMLDIFLPDNVKRIGKGAFSHCHQLEKLVIPENVGILSSKIVFGCGRLKEVWVMGDPSCEKDTFEGLKAGTKIYLAEHEKEESL